MSVKEILDEKGPDVVTATENDTIRTAIGKLNENNIGVIVVVNEADELVGILSERDIIRKSLNQEIGFRDELVKKSMTANVKTVAPDCPIDDVMEIMTRSRIRHVPILDNGKLVGLVSIGDIVKRIITDTEKELDLLKEYISN